MEKPPGRGMPPGKRVRGAKIVELSSVNYPAFPSAGALSLNQRSAHDEETHQKSQELIAWWTARKNAAASKAIATGKNNETFPVFSPRSGGRLPF